MAQTYRLSPGRRAANRVVRLLIRLGLMPGPTYLLTVPGRRTGRPLSTPVTLVEDAGGRWLVAPYGDVGWVRNARAAGQVTLSRGGRAETLAIRELSAAEAAPLLQRYVTRVPITRPFFDAKPDSPVAAFEAEAPRHPVFQLGSGPAFRH
ncbi:MAG TPA: nitroreductase family deazaflavin-dependent oxidoreductase [Candidatus Dormibacteraeota bacterium]|jgi:deazaflavin-dependent oxidoreductase (nitroreductase family)|nr:nitroreductase family deazaflavin-dependent oxidoreductase [Candidatus Dormibacteraeota bacterium]